MADSRTERWKLIAVVVWLAFSITLAIWWLTFGLSQINTIYEMSGVSVNGPGEPSRLALEIARQHRMLLSEGITLILLLLAGGGTLLYYISLELKRSRHLREFFAAFTHDLKTSLASLRLQAESLEEDLQDSNHGRVVKRLVKDTVRIELQLENSLLLASPDDTSQFLIEPVNLNELLQTMTHHWPDLQIEVDGVAIVEADRRAVESIFKNLLQNAVVHGRATKVNIHVTSTGAHATAQLQDNGRGFEGDRKQLGRMFGRHASSSGSGLGLYLACRLARVMHGDLHFNESSQGFSVDVVLPEVRHELRVESRPETRSDLERT